MTALERKGGKWHSRTAAVEFPAPVLINTAHAWADVVAELAGARKIGLQPKRRTVIIFDTSAGIDMAKFPITADCSEQFYLKPESGRVLASPADETPVEPQDIQPDEMDVALVVDRVERASTLKIERIFRRWAGLRSFVKDKNPVIGFAPDAEGFFWLAGQGGYGIQTSYAMGLTAASLASGRGLPAEIKAHGIDETLLGPSRLWAYPKRLERSFPIRSKNLPSSSANIFQRPNPGTPQRRRCRSCSIRQGCAAFEADHRP